MIDSNKKQLIELKNTYKIFKDSKNHTHLDFLKSNVSYCKLIGFDYEKTSKLIALIIGVLPIPGEKFTDCRDYTEEEKIFIKDLKNEFK